MPPRLQDSSSLFSPPGPHASTALGFFLTLFSSRPTCLHGSRILPHSFLLQTHMPPRLQDSSSLFSPPGPHASHTHSITFPHTVLKSSLHQRNPYQPLFLHSGPSHNQPGTFPMFMPDIIINILGLQIIHIEPWLIHDFFTKTDALSPFALE